MARQYFNATLADSIIAASSVTPTTTPTSIFTPYTLCNQAFPIPYGLSAPFAGQVYRFACGGLLTTPSSGTLVITPYYGPGTSADEFYRRCFYGCIFSADNHRQSFQCAMAHGRRDCFSYNILRRHWQHGVA